MWNLRRNEVTFLIIISAIIYEAQIIFFTKIYFLLEEKKSGFGAQG